jgi:formate/nitrite transporter
MMNEIQIDSLLPAEMAEKAESIGVRKANMQFFTMLMLSILAGAFIALGSIFATTIAAGGISVSAAEGALVYLTALPYGVTRLLTGLVFCLGLILVVVGGAELFTGNNLIVMAWASKKVTTSALLRNWVIVYIGNFIGAVGTAVMMFFTKQYTFGSDSVGIAALRIAVSKSELDFVQAIALGILCNVLVCLAVWLTFSARTTLDKIASIIFPITAFVAAGFEHSVANMYFIPYALLVKMFDSEFMSRVSERVANLDSLTWQAFFVNNLIPVTIGNVIGGVVFVAAIYWVVFLRGKKA